METFGRWESNIRSYCRAFPEVFENAQDAYLFSESGNRYIDFFAGAGALNYGHNNEYIKRKVLSYFQLNRILHALDMHTTAKREFIESFRDRVLLPRGLDYKLQFTGPTGTNAVEAALKLARKAKGRPNILAFNGGFHGMSLGALAASSNRASREAAGVSLGNVSFIPFPSPGKNAEDTIRQIEFVLSTDHSGIDYPSAIIFECVQAEGGVNIAPATWIRRLRDLCDRYDLLLICDDIQVGCFRTGTFFSFEKSGIIPDIVLLSKSISGLGLPMSLVLLKPELDLWKPGEHTGTFRGNQLAFVGATAALELASEIHIEDHVRSKEVFLHDFLREAVAGIDTRIEVRGIGMIWGIDLSGLGNPSLARRISADCFRRGLIIEAAGQDDTVLKLLPPLLIEQDILALGCEILRDSIATCIVDA